MRSLRSLDHIGTAFSQRNAARYLKARGSSYKASYHSSSGVVGASHRKYRSRIFAVQMDSITRQSHFDRPWKDSFRSYHAGGTPRTTLEAHQEEVEKIVASVKRFYERGEKFRIYHGSTNSTRKSALGRHPSKVVDTSRLKNVINVDTAAQTVLVEPNVPMDRLVEETLKHGLVPPVVMEFPGITVGGGYSGTSGESSSFKHGFFDRTINSVEIVLANGEVITASDSSNADLFRGAAGAVGTLGVTTMVELQLRKATKFVETTYHPVCSMKEATEKLLDLTSRSDYDYIDGIMYSPTSGAVITGRMTDNDNGLSIQRFSAAKDPWFYLHVKDQISAHNIPKSEAIPLTEYLFRYDRGGFWVGAATFDYTKLPFNKFTRWFFDDWLHTRMLYSALHASGQSEEMIVQDLAIPYNNAAEFVEKMDDMLGIWPLWLCPLKQSLHPTMHPHYSEFEADRSLKPMLNIGLWGKLPAKYKGRFVEMNREIESILQELRGMKWLYAQTYFSEQDFWKDFDKDHYDSLRKMYHAETLPSVYDKVRVDVESEKNAKANATLTQKLIDLWPISGLYGAKKAYDTGDYLAARNAGWRHWVPRT